MIALNVNIVFAYSDTAGHWAEKNINNLSINGIISGVDTKVYDIKKQIDSNNNSIWWYEKKLKELKG